MVLCFWFVLTRDLQLQSLQQGSSIPLCLDAAPAPLPPNPCSLLPGNSQPWCNYKLDLDTRVSDLVSRIPAGDVVGLFSNGAKGVPSLNIPAYQWWSEALHGVGGSPGVTFSGDTPYATSFPQVILSAASFNKTLWHAIGRTISTEARAFSNVGHAGNTFWTPNVNIYRDPRWGRGQETPGEDPMVNADYAANFVPGMQGGGIHVISKRVHVANTMLHITSRTGGVLTDTTSMRSSANRIYTRHTTHRSNHVYSVDMSVVSCAHTMLLMVYLRVRMNRC